MEPLTTQLLTELMPKLHTAFPRNLGQGNPAMMVEVYRNGLRGLSGDAVRAAVDRVIQEDQYFPKVSRLRELATKWQQANRPTPSLDHHDAPWNRCPVCGAEAQPIVVTRWVRDPAKGYALVLNEHGQPIKEEVQSASLYMLHDPAKHRVFAQPEG